MRKILMLMIVVMLMGLMGCGTEKTEDTKYRIDINTGEKVPVTSEPVSRSTVLTTTIYGEIHAEKNQWEEDNYYVIFTVKNPDTGLEYQTTAWNLSAAEYEIACNAKNALIEVEADENGQPKWPLLTATQWPIFAYQFVTE